MASESNNNGQVPSVFDLDDDARNRMQAAYRRGIRSIRNILFLVAGMTALFEVLAYWRIWFTYPTPRILLAAAFDVAVIGAYIALGIWAGKKPFTALMLGLLLYLGIQTGRMLIMPFYNSSALLAKAMVVALFVSGLRRARALQNKPEGIG